MARGTSLPAVRSAHKMPFGAECREDGSVCFRLFAPAVDSVQVQLEGESEPLPATATGDGWHVLTTDRAQAGTRYRFLLPDGTAVSDPASRYQPEDVGGPSEVIDPRSFAWTDAGWTGRPWEEAVLYELHVGTFTEQGTFQSAIARLDHLVELGVTAIELMCLSDFAGNRNWGYDGVLLYAPDSAYGHPDDCKAFIDAAHHRGLMVILDVVYNHFGPEGNYLSRYFPEVCSEKHTETPWGKALNFDGPGSREVRELIIENALYWVEEFHVDGLRIDASHAMIDDSPRHVLDELRDRVLAASRGRHVHFILENETNIADRLRRDTTGAPESYTAQWNHDITHLLAAVFGATCAKPAEQAAAETDKLGKALASGFVIAAEERGALGAAPALPPTAYIAFIQTHDLVGNRVFGERISALVSSQSVRAIAAVYLLLPQIPMLFMGEEWAASTPFPFFTDYHGPLADAIRAGRCEQLSKLDPAPSAEELKRAPDPQADSTLRSAQLRWNELEESEHRDQLAWYRRILAVRQRSVVPLLQDLSTGIAHYEILGPGALKIVWTLAHGKKLRLAANLCDQQARGFGNSLGSIIWTEGDATEGKLGPWSVQYSVD